MTLWEMTNVLPGSILEKDIAAFPDELAYRIVKLFSYVGETVLDPFCGSGTTMKISRLLKRNSCGIEIIRDLEPTIRIKLGFNGITDLFNPEDSIEIIERKEGKYRFFEKNKSENRLAV